MNDILIIIDVQNDFVTGPLSTPEAPSIISPLISLIESHQGPIICTQDTHNSDYLDTQEGHLLPVPHCIVGTPGHSIHPAIRGALAGKSEAKLPASDFVAGNVTYINKDTFAATFLPDDLAEFLPPYGTPNPPKIIITGLCTDICVVSNALLLKSSFPDIPIYVAPACCAGTSPSAHEAALQVMRSCQILTF